QNTVINPLFFFFSSSRRHTSSKRDWSSDVCSSDLTKPIRGLATIGIATLSTNLFQCTPTPAAATPTPTRPPIKAWDDDEGIPKRSEERRVGKEGRSG